MSVKGRLQIIQVKQPDDTWKEVLLDQLKPGDIFKAFYEDGSPFTFYDTEHDLFEFVEQQVYIDGELSMFCKPHDLDPAIAERFIMEK